MTTIVSKLKVRRGPSADFIGGSGVILDEGELGLVLDTRGLYIGYGGQYFPAGNMKLISELDGIDKLAPAVANYSMNGNRIVDMGRAVNDFDAVTLIDLTQFVQSGTRSTILLTNVAANPGAPANLMIDPVPAVPATTSLNALVGAYSIFRVYYTVLRAGSVQGGTLTIIDSGTGISSGIDLTDVSLEVPTVGSVGIDFSVAISSGVRYLRYATTVGANFNFLYSIDRWGPAT